MEQGSKGHRGRRDETARRTDPTSVWPGEAPFALFLSHDVDQVYDRELFRVLGDLNHLRRVWFQGEQGIAAACIRRISRALVRPKPPGRDIKTILEIERNAGVHSTFFLLEDKTFNRFGGRYRYDEPEIVALARRIQAAGCEIAVHGAYHNFNDEERYRQQARSFQQAFGRLAKGIRNHFLRHDGVATWAVQRAAGFAYDASFGFTDRVGVRGAHAFPFAPLRARRSGNEDFVVLPLSIMDSSLFRCMRLEPNEAINRCLTVADEVQAQGGVLTLNWHNNYFDEPEYSDWQLVYEQLLDQLMQREPYCATGEEIATWWKSERGMVSMNPSNHDGFHESEQL